MTLFCFMDNNGSVRPESEKDGCLKYEFNLETRTILEPDNVERPFLHDAVAKNYFDKLVGTPGKLMDFAWEGNLSKLDLASLLLSEKREIYLDVCARFEKALTETCTAKGNPCLEDGCAVSEEEACLNALLETREVCTRAYASMWIHLFINPENRVPAWRN